MRVELEGKTQRLLHKFYTASVILKGVDGLAEVVGGFLVLILPTRTITRTILFIAHLELVEGPRHAIINFILHLLSDFSLQTRQFYGLLFLSHGAIKLFLVGGLLRNKMWAYPATILIFAAFVFYQVFEIWLSPSMLLSIITVIDIFVVILIAREYQKARRRY